MINMDKLEEKKQKEKELVLARLEVLSPELCFSFGGAQSSMTRDEVITSVIEGDEIGQEFIKTDLEFLRSLADGSLLRKLTAST